MSRAVGRTLLLLPLGFRPQLPARLGICLGRGRRIRTVGGICDLAANLGEQRVAGHAAFLFLGGDGVCTAEIAKLSGNAKTLENVVCATGGASLDKMPGGTAWKAKYDKLYPGQFQVYSPYTYDATYVLVDAMKRADSTDPKVYKAKLPSTDYQGVTARIQFEPNGELKNPATTLYTYKNGVKTPID